MNYYQLSWNNGMHCMSLYILIVQFSTKLHTVQYLQMWKFGQTLNSWKTHISRPNGRAMGVFRVFFAEKCPWHFSRAQYLVQPLTLVAVSEGYPILQSPYSWFPLFQINADCCMMRGFARISSLTHMCHTQSLLGVKPSPEQYRLVTPTKAALCLSCSRIMTSKFCKRWIKNNGRNVWFWLKNIIMFGMGGVPCSFHDCHGTFYEIKSNQVYFL